MTASVTSRIRWQRALLVDVLGVFLVALVWVLGDDDVRDALPSFNPLVSVVLPAAVIFPVWLRYLFGCAGCQLALCVQSPQPTAGKHGGRRET